MLAFFLIAYLIFRRFFRVSKINNNTSHIISTSSVRHSDVTLGESILHHVFNNERSFSFRFYLFHAWTQRFLFTNFRRRCQTLITQIQSFSWFLLSRWQSKGLLLRPLFLFLPYIFHSFFVGIAVPYTITGHDYEFYLGADWLDDDVWEATDLVLFRFWNVPIWTLWCIFLLFFSLWLKARFCTFSLFHAALFFQLFQQTWIFILPVT